MAAARAGERAKARDLLLRVLEADPANEAASLWLSAALDSLPDQLMALEHLLAINPGHPQARAGAEALRKRLNPAAAPADAEAETGPTATKPETAVEAPVERVATGQA